MGEVRTGRGRCKQVANWLRDQHPTPFPVEVRFLKRVNLSKENRGLEGWAERIGSRFRITIVQSTRTTKSMMLDILLHEWAHCMVAQPGKWDERSSLTSEGKDRSRADFAHDATWGICYAALIESYHDLDPPGQVVSKDYPATNPTRR